MAKKTVLAIGIDPGFADLAAFPQFTPDLIRSYIDAQIERLRELGFAAESCLIDLGETAEAAAAGDRFRHLGKDIQVSRQCAEREIAFAASNLVPPGTFAARQVAKAV
jgi:hypothetical protein